MSLGLGVLGCRPRELSEELAGEGEDLDDGGREEGGKARDVGDLGEGVGEGGGEGRPVDVVADGGERRAECHGENDEAERLLRGEGVGPDAEGREEDGMGDVEVEVERGLLRLKGRRGEGALEREIMRERERERERGQNEAVARRSPRRQKSPYRRTP